MTHTHARARRSGVSLILTFIFAFIPLADGALAQPAGGARNARRPATSTTPSVAAQATTRQAAAQARPRLVLLIVIDQFRADYFERFGDLFAANGGLRRLTREGAQWTNANFDHMPTY